MCVIAELMEQRKQLNKHCNEELESGRYPFLTKIISNLYMLFIYMCDLPDYIYK